MKMAMLIFILASLAAAAQKPALVRHPGRALLDMETDDSDIRVVSAFVAKGAPVPAECEDEAHTFARNLVRYPRPNSWHWILICDEAGWQSFLRSAKNSVDGQMYASTDLAARSTYLRGRKMLYPYDLGAEPERVIAHELAHIYLHSSDEEEAERLSVRWRRDWRRSGVLADRQVVVRIWENEVSTQ